MELNDLERYAFSDPASGKQKLKKVRSRQAIVVVGVDFLLRIFVLLAWAGRLTTSKFRDKLLSIHDEFKPRRFGIEANAMQELFGDLVIEKAKEEFGASRFMPIHQPTRIEKEFKIRTALEPVIADGRLFLQDDQVELRSEVASFPTGHFKDLVDALASAIMLIPRRFPQQEKRQETEALAKYLRDTGAPAWYIQQKVENMKGVRL